MSYGGLRRSLLTRRLAFSPRTEIADRAVYECLGVRRRNQRRRRSRAEHVWLPLWQCGRPCGWWREGVSVLTGLRLSPAQGGGSLGRTGEPDMSRSLGAQTISEEVRVGGHDDLAVLGCDSDELGEGFDHRSVQPGFWFVQHEKTGLPLSSTPPVAPAQHPLIAVAAPSNRIAAAAQRLTPLPVFGTGSSSGRITPKLHIGGPRWGSHPRFDRCRPDPTVIPRAGCAA